jgi:diacylglycerol kinase family enzyme
MRIRVLYNPIAGSGRAGRAAQAVEAGLAARGHDVTRIETRLEPAETWLDEVLGGTDLLVVAGGDGAMRLAGEPAARAGVPVYHYPAGTENLFAREFGCDRSVERLVAAVERFDVRAVDTATANGHPFLLMASLGYDAEVVHDLAGRRGASITRSTYAGPMLRQLVRWTAPRLSVDVDGEVVVEGEPGFVVVANSRQYGQRFDPAPRARMDDGRLDAVFFPTRSRAGLVRWALLCRTGRHVRDPRLVYRLGREIEVRSATPRRYQVDGDPPENEAGPVPSVRISVAPGRLQVLIP